MKSLFFSGGGSWKENFMPPPKSWSELTKLWHLPGGIKESLVIAGPLILSMSSLAIQQLVDRIFLGQYSANALGAASAAGAVSFLVISFFMGVAAYTNTFVAQYNGANRPHRVGPSVWQAIYFSGIASVVLIFAAFLGSWIFKLAGHSEELMEMEMTYFKILCLGGGFVILSNAIGSFFTGLGRSWTAMWVQAVATVVNVVFDYVWIFGKWGFAEMGIAGAAWATVLSSAVATILYVICFFTKYNRIHFSTLSGFKFDYKLFCRLIKFGGPSGLHFMLDVLGFALFLIFIGRVGELELAVTGIGFQVNSLAFMPMLGFMTAISTLVGRSVAQERLDVAIRAVWTSFYLTMIYMVIIACSYILIPEVYINFFGSSEAKTSGSFDQIRAMAVIVLRFVAIYSLFDAINVVFVGALRGAGDTRIVMIAMCCLSWTLMVVPSWISINYLPDIGNLKFFSAWTALSAFVIGVAFFFLFRFLGGAWRTMRVIEHTPVVEEVEVWQSLYITEHAVAPELDEIEDEDKKCTHQMQAQTEGAE